ncbi:heavy metal translocating P-type ATPase [Legionella pneumophila]|uniref:heavy metal translocating P-type ATPase n=1 Tax=Legionella pneumophila TaxID=446 RepID=UPI00277BC79A|nr:heavy metal translocating P-type ATPase [Legionella pneumophila]
MNYFFDAIKTKWQFWITIYSIIAIVLYIIMKIINVPYINVPLILTIIIGGLPLFIQISIKLVQGDLGADTLAALSLITGVILHEYLAACLIILMLASGQTLEVYARRKASSVLQALISRMPSKVHIRKNEQITDIPLSETQIGDEIIIYPHETCPVDGEVIDGHGTMDESYLTGEPYLIAKAPGVTVLSGAINGEALLVVKASKRPSDSRYAAIVEVLKEAEQKKPTLRRLGDQIGAIFTPIALFFALLAWYFSGDPIRFLSVLVIATPCPLLIAIPITIISAVSMAAKQAIIIKDPTILERLPTCQTAIFDKTGTLTYGKPTLTKIITTETYSHSDILQYAASLERYSKHPLSNSILDAAKERGLTLLQASEVFEKPGQGLLGKINDHSVQVTSRKKFLAKHPEEVGLLPEHSSGLECLILIDEQFAAVLQFHDAPREESHSFIHHLAPSHQFKKIMLVSGDRESEVKYLGKLLELTEIYSSQSPEQKLKIVRDETRKAPTLYMGDGINDAPALTAATVGIAFGQYSNVTAEAAGAVIMENTLNKVDELMHLSINTRKIALQSAIGGMLLSIIGMSFAALGFINPVTGAILQELIDILAIINALQLTWGSRVKIDLPGYKV